MSNLRALWQYGPYNNKHTEQHTKNVEHQGATDIQNKSTVLCFSDFFPFIFIYNFLNDLSYIWYMYLDRVLALYYSSHYNVLYNSYFIFYFIKFKWLNFEELFDLSIWKYMQLFKLIYDMTLVLFARTNKNIIFITRVREY